MDESLLLPPEIQVPVISQNFTNKLFHFLDFKICRVLNAVCFLLGNSLVSEFYMTTFQNTLSVPPS